MGQVATLPKALIMNALRRMETMFPGYFPDAKHDHYKDFGWPKELGFNQFYDIWSRNGLGAGAVKKTATKCWEDNPVLRESKEDEAGEETELERSLQKLFEDLRLWQHLAEADRRGMVGRYAGVILRFADSKPFREEADNVPGGLEGLVEVIPAWEGQLTVAEWDVDETSETYGQPLMFKFNESAVASKTDQHAKPRAFEVHPSRVVIWSDDGTVHGQSLLQAGYNDLLTLEKIIGAGGEGFWKNAKSAPHLNVSAETKLTEVAQSMGFATVDAMVEAMDENVEGWQSGFDKLLMTQGMDVQTLQVTLPIPEHFFGITLQSFAASIEMPVKILTGMQTGERASQEDADEWSKTCQSRRKNILIPNIRTLIKRLEAVGILKERDWYVKWTDLTETSMPEKIDRADKMASVNQKMAQGGEIIFTPEEIRDAVDLKPLSEADKFRDDDDLTDEEDDL